LNIAPGFDHDADGRPIIGLAAEDLYAYGDLIRRTEELILAQFSRGLVSGTTHTCLGQELCALAVARALRHSEDVALSNHRNHGHFLAYSGDFLGLVAEVMGREAGVCGGHGGSQHLAYKHFHSNGVQGGMSAIGVGLSLARKLDGRGGVVALMVGDGTLGQGLLYESMNLASIWNLPMLFVVENNGIAQTTYTRDTLGGSIEGRGLAFGLEVGRFDDANPAIFAEIERLAARARDTSRPALVIIDTRRLGPHSKGDDLRPEAEKAAIAARDPLQAMGAGLPAATKAAIDLRNEAFVKAVEAAANASPEARFEQPPQHIFTRPLNLAADIGSLCEAGDNARAALNKALRYLLESTESAILLGEDLHDPYGGAFKVTAGLSTDFPGRVISTPISEAGITGTAIGLALAGFRPVLEIMFADFLSLCMDQLYNHAVKFPGMFRDMEVPLTIRTPSGGRRGYGPTHSQSPENIFTAIPGLTVVFGSHRHDLGRLLVDATLSWPYPVLFLEHKLLYGEIQARGEYTVLEGAADDALARLFPTLVRRARGEPDLTIVAYGGMAPVVEQVAEYLAEEEELEVEILLPALLAPLPKATLIADMAGRARVAVVEESHGDYGVGAEILASLLEAGFRGKALRIGAPPAPIPSARSLESQMLPGEERIIAEILQLF
jgi:2-oxoisovalerate dehydrogenase E1 component